MHTKWIFVKSVPTSHPLIIEHIYNVVDTGGCQCNKDCDCYKNKGKLLGTASNFTGIRYYPNGTLKKYNTFKDCLQSVNS